MLKGKKLDLKAPSLPSLPTLPSPPALPSIPKLSSPSLPKLPSPPALPQFSSDSVVSAISTSRSKFASAIPTPSRSASTDEISAETAVLEPVYIVLRPLNLLEAPGAYLKRLGKLVKAVEFENYLMLQHWGVLIGDQYYHLHINDETKNISVSMVPFVKEAKVERHTIKFPIWRTSLTHDERVGVAVGIIKNMGGFSSETDVEITDETGKVITSPTDRERYTMDGRYLRSPIAEHRIFRGKYNALTNNCIHFTRHYILEQILTRRKELKHFGSNIQWLVGKWGDMGCQRGPIELYKFLSGILGIGNPFSMTPDKGARLMIKLLSIFLNIEYNPTLDKKLLDDTTPVDDAINELSDSPVAESAEPQKGVQGLPIPEILPGQEDEGKPET